MLISRVIQIVNIAHQAVIKKQMETVHYAQQRTVLLARFPCVFPVLKDFTWRWILLVKNTVSNAILLARYAAVPSFVRSVHQASFEKFLC